MPDMGLDAKDFTVFTWNLKNWKKLEKKLTSPDFECGGHKWQAHAYILVCHQDKLLTWILYAGVYFSSLLATPMRPQMTRYRYIWTMLNPRRLPRAGMPVLNLLL
jgi:hypothetical protein